MTKWQCQLAIYIVLRTIFNYCIYNYTHAVLPPSLPQHVFVEPEDTCNLLAISYNNYYIQFSVCTNLVQI